MVFFRARDLNAVMPIFVRAHACVWKYQKAKYFSLTFSLDELEVTFIENLRGYKAW